MAFAQKRSVPHSFQDSNSHYALRSSSRRSGSLYRNRREIHPASFISQSRDRYSSDTDENDDSSTLVSDRETDEENIETSHDEDINRNEFDDGGGDDDDNIEAARICFPEIDNMVEMPILNLPESSVDLMIDNENVQQAVGIYQVLRQFSGILRLSPFRFEDFCAALIVNEQSCLLVETHIALLKCILLEEDGNNSSFGPHDAKDSVNISLFLIDSLTWFEVLRLYLGSLARTEEIQQVLPFFNRRHYQDLNTTERLLLLQTLSDIFLTTNLVREAIIKEGAFIHEEQCRLCHRRGDLICCETCPAVFHLECLTPPLKSVPDEDWFCGVCSALQVKGINEGSSALKRNGLLSRLEPLGFDRHHRKYWLLCRRILVEGENKTWYYSSLTQLEELLSCLDHEKWEAELVSILMDMKDVIVDQMAVTEELTNVARGKRKSALADHDEFLLEEKLKMSLKAETAETPKQGGETDDRCTVPSIEEMSSNEKNSEETSLLSETSAMETSEATDFSNKDKVVSNSADHRLQESSARECEDDVKEPEQNDVMDAKFEEETDKGANSICTEKAVDECKSGDDVDKTSVLVEPCATVDALPLQEDKGETGSTIRESSVLEARQTRSMSRNLTNLDMSEGETLTGSRQSLRATPTLFKLGMEGNYKNYVNLYATNALSLSKQQQNDDRDRRRHLSYKFSLTPRSEFSWNAVVYGLMRQTIEAVRKGLLGLEASVDRCFLHPNWSQNCGRWQKAVSFCSTASEFGLALMIFEACMKPLLFNSVWHESLGHVQLQRTTASEREERKKKEKDLKRFRNDDDWFSGTSVKYSLGLHHQVWKQKGEEYRSTGKGGWYWVSSSRSRHLSLTKCHNLIGHGCTSKQTPSKEQELLVSKESVDVDNETKSDDVAGRDLTGDFNGGQEIHRLDSETSGKNIAGECSDPFSISAALLSRSAYHKRSLTKCFLDDLLERRKRHSELELKQKGLLELAIKKFEMDAVLMACTASAHPPKEKCGGNDIGGNSSGGKSSNSCSTKLNFCSEESQDRQDHEEEDSDHEVELEKDLDDKSSVGSAVGNGEIDDVAMSEDSNISNASSFMNVVPPPIRNISFGRPPVKQMSCNLAGRKEKASNGLLCDAKNSDTDDRGAGIRIECKLNVIYSLETYITDGDVLLTSETAKKIKEKLSEIGETKFPVRLSDLSGREKKRKRHIRKGGIPRAQNFQTKNNKISLFALEKEDLAAMGRKGGQKEADGFNYSCKIHDVDWPYLCPRPYFKTAWRYRTQMAVSLSAIALQLRILWASIRWDDMATKYPAGKSNSSVTDDCITTVELLKRRDIGPTNLRAEYLVQKTLSPLEVPVASKERLPPPQRSGLRERRQPEASVLKEPVTSELWVPEEQLELWEVKLFAERLDKQRHKLRERGSEKRTKSVATSAKSLEFHSDQSSRSSHKSIESKATETTVKTDSAVVEEELQKQRLQMQQKRLGLLRGQPQSMSRLSPTEAKGKAVPAASESCPTTTPGSLKLPGRRLLMPKVNRQERNLSVTTASSSRTTLHSSPAVAPTSSSTPSPTLLPLPNVQSIRIKKGADGKLQITGLQPGQEIISLADGRLRLVTKPSPQSTPVKPGHSPVLGNSTPVSSQPQATAVRDTVTSRPSSSGPAEHQDKITANTECKSSDSAVSAELNPSLLKSDSLQSEKSPDVKNNSPKQPSPQPLTSEQQTNATVATAVEKLFACLSPLRLQNRRRSSETKVSDGPSLSGSAVDSDETPLPNASNSSSFVTSQSTSSSATISVPHQQQQTSGILCSPGKLWAAALNASESGAAGDAVDSVAAVSACPSANRLEPQRLTFGQLIPISELRNGSGGFLIMMPSSSNGALTEADGVKNCVLQNESGKGKCNAGHGVAGSAKSGASCSGSNSVNEICKRKLFESTIEESDQTLKKKENTVGKAPHRTESKSPLNARPTVADSGGRQKRKLSEASKDVKRRKQIDRGYSHAPNKATRQVQKATKSVTKLESTSVNRHFPESQEVSGTKYNRSDEADASPESELFCVCRTPYDPDGFYIGCDECNGWFHGRCVDVAPTDVQLMDGFLCRLCCLKRVCEGVSIKERQWSSLRQLVSALKTLLTKRFCMSPVIDDSDDDDYLKELFDLSTVERKVDGHLYVQLKDFVVEVLQMFSNCYDFHRRTSHIIKNAVAIEKEFLSNFEKVMSKDFNLHVDGRQTFSTH